MPMAMHGGMVDWFSCIGLAIESFSVGLKDASESAAVTMLGREFQALGAVQRKARPKKIFLWHGELLHVCDLLSVQLTQ